MANPVTTVGETLRGMGVTLKNFFRQPVTVQYPDQMRRLPPRERGRHVLHRYENGLERCIACMLCSGTCPAAAIYIEPDENDPAKPTSYGERYARVFQIDMLRCIFCGYCQAACPTGAITLESNTALAEYSREKMLYNKENMLEPLGTSTRGAALAWESPPPPEAKVLIPDFKGVFDGWETTSAAVGKGNLPPEAGSQGATKPIGRKEPLLVPGRGVANALPTGRTPSTPESLWDSAEEEKKV
jgi:NADH-quinone oxidoreductase subunit I